MVSKEVTDVSLHGNELQKAHGLHLSPEQTGYTNAHVPVLYFYDFSFVLNISKFMKLSHQSRQ